MDKYEIIKNLGRGSYGRVDLAKLRSTNEQWAIKKVKLSAMSKEERKKALAEANVLAKLNHPNIVTYKESFQENSSLYIVMEYMDGGDLEKKIQQRGKSFLTEQDVLFNFVQILLPISYLHKEKILHRDIKPQNCFMTKHGIVKLGDFGVARSLEQSFDLAKTVIGTPFYLAPEIWDNHPYSFSADIYSLGVVLYELCSLKKPFDAESATQLFTKVMRADHTPIPSFFSTQMKKLVESMLQKDPNLRPTADEILRMPFIQNAIKDLVNFNKQKIVEIPKVVAATTPKKKPAVGRQRLLNPNLMVTMKVDDEPVEKQEPEMSFEDDFIDLDEDDFISDSEEEEEDFDNDAFHLLEEVTMRLQESIMPGTGLKSKSSPAFNKTKTDPKKVDAFRTKLEGKLGKEKFLKIYTNLKSLENPSSLREIRKLERDDQNSVEEVKELIEMEESLSCGI